MALVWLGWENSQHVATLLVFFLKKKWRLTQIWVVLIGWSTFPTNQKLYPDVDGARHQYGISVLVSQTSFFGETTSGIAKHWLFFSGYVWHLCCAAAVHVWHNWACLEHITHMTCFWMFCFKNLLSCQTLLNKSRRLNASRTPSRELFSFVYHYPFEERIMQSLQKKMIDECFTL